MLRRHWRPVVLLVVVLAVAAVPVGRWLLGGDGAGTVVGVRTAVRGDAVTVVVPTTQLRFEVGEPREDVPVEDALDGQAHAAARNTRFVGVEIKTLRAQLEPTVGDAFDTGAEPELRAWLTSGGSRVPLPTDGTDTAFVAVAGDGRDVGIEVRFDGVTQRADARTGEILRGKAGPLYADTTRANSLACGRRRPTLPGFAYDFACAGGPLVVTPWVRGLGWADTGRTWAVTAVYTTLADLRWSRSAGGPVARYDVGSAERRLTVDGVTPTQIVPGPYKSGPQGRQDVVAFDVPRGVTPRFGLTQRFEGRVRAGRGSPGAPARPTITVRSRLVVRQP